VLAAAIIRIVLMMEAAGTNETSINFYHTTRRNNPEDSHLYTVSLNAFRVFFELYHTFTGSY
jgi:hypothetical protein